MTENEELNIKLAEFALKKEACDQVHPCEGGHYIAGDKVFYGIYDLPHFPEDETACFRYLAPQRKVPIVGIRFRYFPGGTECQITYIP